MDLKAKMALKEYTPTIYDLNKYYDDEGFVGDESTRLLLPIAVIRRKCIGIVSASGSGKSAVTDAMMSLLDKEQMYIMEAGSEKAQAYKHDEINQKDLIYLTELQKVGDGEVAIELLKNLGEGKEYTRSVVQPDKTVLKQTIKSGKAIVYTKAIENKFESDAELDRRFPKLPTDISKKQNKRVIRSKASRRASPFAPKVLDATKRNALRGHMQSLLKEDANKYTFINPLANYLSEYIPDTFAISRTYTDHYLDFIEGIAYFNKENRITTEMEFEDKEHKVIFVAPEDCWQLHKIYGEQFLNDVLNIPPNGTKIIDVFKLAEEKGVGKQQKSIFEAGNNEPGKTQLTIHQIFNLLKESGIVLKENVIKKMLIDLMMGGYVHSETLYNNNKNEEFYYLNEEIEEFQDGINWEEAIKAGVEVMKKEYPQFAAKYINEYCKSSSFQNPFTGENELVNTNVTDEVEEPIFNEDESVETPSTEPTPKTIAVPEQQDDRDDW